MLDPIPHLCDLLQIVVRVDEGDDTTQRVSNTGNVTGAVIIDRNVVAVAVLDLGAPILAAGKLKTQLRTVWCSQHHRA